jgi:hypothetical protein
MVKFESDCKAFDLQQRLEGLRTQSELLQREVERLQRCIELFFLRKDFLFSIRSAINSLSVKCVGSVTVSLVRILYCRRRAISDHHAPSSF